MNDPMTIDELFEALVQASNPGYYICDMHEDGSDVVLDGRFDLQMVCDAINSRFGSVRS
jgi:hypothetical protein